MSCYLSLANFLLDTRLMDCLMLVYLDPIPQPFVEKRAQWTLISIKKLTTNWSTHLEFQISEALGLTCEFITHNSHSFYSST